MHSYIKIHQFTPRPDYLPLDLLIPKIDKILKEQNALSVIGEELFFIFKQNLLQCMEVYYRLTGIDDRIISGKGAVQPQGILPRYTESLIEYFQLLERQGSGNKEITALEYSGVHTIKVRYKYTDSVIKKLVKLGLRNPKVLEEPLKIFLKGGALHDLIGILFICAYPYEKEWVARTLYNFFEYDHRTDDHLLYGFYTVEKKSGYRALHCDHTLFNPRFDADIVGKCGDTAPADPYAVFSLLDPADSATEVLRKLKDYFNIEIQLHTTFENLWSSMEHTNSYNIQAKGVGRSSKIRVQWKLLSDMMKNLESQFEQLQVDTEQARFEVLHHTSYIPVKELLDGLGSDAYPVHAEAAKTIETLEALLKSHEISRQEYVAKLQEKAEYLEDFAQQQQNLTVRMVFQMLGAFIYYGLANQRAYFNTDDIRQFVKKALASYSSISTFLSSHPEIYLGNLLNIITIFRYLYLGHKYGLGLMNPPETIVTDEDIPSLSATQSLRLFETAISLLNGLSEEELGYLNKDRTNALKIIHHYDLLAREWELFGNPESAPSNAALSKSIQQFRSRFIDRTLHQQFNILLESDKIKNIGFVVKFYTTLVWHGFYLPMDALKQIIRYSAYDKIKPSDLFYYELAAYRFLYLRRCNTLEDCDKPFSQRLEDPVKVEHFGNYHRKNMIQLLFRIKRSESAYNFHKARLFFEQLTQTKFKIDHFSGMVLKEKHSQ
jgi:ppGpp synthetase/RelA/SpoT-type nucleotidyltranferase